MVAYSKYLLLLLGNEPNVMSVVKTELSVGHGRRESWEEEGSSAGSHDGTAQND